MSVSSCPDYTGPLHPTYTFDPDCSCRGTGEHADPDLTCGFWMVDPTEPDAGLLADMLRVHAATLYRQEAAVELLAAHGHWLHNHRFRPYLDTYIAYTTGHRANTPMAYVHWAQVATALDRGELYGSGSELAVLRIAASLGSSVEVNLADALTSLDVTNSHLVAKAVLHATGHRQDWSA